MKRRWLRILAGLGIVAVVCGLYAWFFGLQTIFLLETRKIARRTPIVNETPHPLTDRSMSTAKGTRLSYFGYDFEIPWDDLDPAQTKVYPNRVALRFRSGRSFMFANVPPRNLVNTTLQEVKLETARATLGDSALQSDYAMWSTILAATPDRVNLLSPTGVIVRNNMLLVMKSVAVPERSGIFSLQTGNFRGFQWGDPAKKRGGVVVDLFTDECGLEFVFSGTSNKNPQGISQPEINRVLETIHKSAKDSKEPGAKPALVAATK